MARRVFFSFHFKNDFWRTQQVRNINALEGQTLCSANDWEEVKKKGDASIEKWIADQLNGKSCVIVLTGAETSERRWVQHEIAKGWNDGKGVVAIRIHRLLDSDSNSSTAGTNPLEKLSLKSGKKLSEICQIKSPAGADSKAVYNSIKDNIEDWIEEAIKIRKAN